MFLCRTMPNSEQRSSHRGTLLRSLLRIVLDSAVFQSAIQSVKSNSQTGVVPHPLSTSTTHTATEDRQTSHQLG